MMADYQILQYLKGIPSKIFTDANWARFINDRELTTGYCYFVWGNLVTWSSKKQIVVEWSNAKSYSIVFVKEFDYIGYLKNQEILQATL